MCKIKLEYLHYQFFCLYKAKGGSELHCYQDTWKQEVINNAGAGRIILALSFSAHLPLLQCGFFRNVCMSLFSSRYCLRFRAGSLICGSGPEIECRPLKTHQWVGGIDTRPITWEGWISKVTQSYILLKCTGQNFTGSCEYV